MDNVLSMVLFGTVLKRVLLLLQAAFLVLYETPNPLSLYKVCVHDHLLNHTDSRRNGTCAGLRLSFSVEFLLNS